MNALLIPLILLFVLSGPPPAVAAEPLVADTEVGVLGEGPLDEAALRTLLEGVWTRPLAEAGGQWEGFRLEEDGRLVLLGVYPLDGVAWRLEGRELVLTTGSRRYGQPREVRYAVEVATPRTLTLASEGGYFVGVYQRRTRGLVSGELRISETLYEIPPGLSARVWLREIDPHVDVPRVVATDVVSPVREFPIRFELPFSYSEIEPTFNYTVEAEVRDTAGKLLVERLPARVLTWGRGDEAIVDLRVLRPDDRIGEKVPTRMIEGRYQWGYRKSRIDLCRIDRTFDIEGEGEVTDTLRDGYVKLSNHPEDRVFVRLWARPGETPEDGLDEGVDGVVDVERVEVLRELRSGECRGGAGADGAGPVVGP